MSELIVYGFIAYVIIGFVVKVTMGVSAPVRSHREELRDEREDMELYKIRMERCAAQHGVPALRVSRDVDYINSLKKNQRKDVFNDIMNEYRHNDDTRRDD